MPKQQQHSQSNQAAATHSWQRQRGGCRWRSPRAPAARSGQPAAAASGTPAAPARRGERQRPHDVKGGATKHVLPRSMSLPSRCMVTAGRTQLNSKQSSTLNGCKQQQQLLHARQRLMRKAGAPLQHAPPGQSLPAAGGARSGAGAPCFGRGGTGACGRRRRGMPSCPRSSTCRSAAPEGRGGGQKALLVRHMPNPGCMNAGPLKAQQSLPILWADVQACSCRRPAPGLMSSWHNCWPQ